MSTSETPHRSSRVIFLIFLTIFIDMLGIGILIPIIPILISPLSPERVLSNDWSASSGFILAGWLMAVYPLMQFIFTPILGQLSDKYGRRLLLVLSIGGTALSYALFAVALIFRNIPLMFASRMLDGASGGNIAIAQAVIGDTSVASDRAKNFGLIGSALGLGFIFGPFLGGTLSDPSIVSWFSVTTPFWFAALLSTLNVLFVLLFLPETLKTPSTLRLEFMRSIKNIYQSFFSQRLKNIIPPLFFFNAGFTFFTTFWGMVLIERFLFHQGEIGSFFAYMGLMTVLAQGLLVRQLSGKIETVRVLRYSIIGSGVCILAFFFVPFVREYLIYVIVPFFAVGIALTKAFSLSLLTQIGGETSRGEIMGINASAGALAQAIPAILAGYVAATAVASPIFWGGIMMIFGGILFLFLYRNTAYTEGASAHPSASM